VGFDRRPALPAPAAGGEHGGGDDLPGRSEHAPAEGRAAAPAQGRPAVPQRRVAHRRHAQGRLGHVGGAIARRAGRRLRLPRCDRAADPLRGPGRQHPGARRRRRAGGRHQATAGPRAVRRRVGRRLAELRRRARGPGAAGAVAVHHRRQPRLASCRDPRLAAGGGATLLRAQAPQPAGQGAGPRAGGSDRRLPPHRLRRERGRRAGRLYALRARLGEALSRRRAQPAGGRRRVVDRLRLSARAMEDAAHHG
jgi:hypothetical protein